MKTIKYSFSALFIALFCTFIFSCSKEYSSPLKGQKVEDMRFYGASSTNSTTIGNVNLSNFTAVSSDYWCSVRITGSLLEVTVSKNSTEQQRRATISIIDPEDGTTLTFNVFQTAYGEIQYGKDTYTFPEEGGEITINVKSNVNYKVEIPSDANWLTVSSSSTRGLKPSTIVLKASKNETGKERSTVVQLSDTETNTIEKINIVQEVTPYVVADNTEFNINMDGGEFEFTIKANVKFKVQCRYSWAEIVEETEIDEFHYKYKVKVSPTTSNEPRYNYVYFRNIKNDVLLEVIEIFQDGYLYIKKNEFNIYNLNVGNTFQIRCVNNTGKSVIWKSSDSSVAEVDDNGKVTGKREGEATISVTSADGKYTDETNVKVISNDNKESNNIEDNIRCSWSGSYMQVGGWIQASISCTIKNNSSYDVELKKVTIYKDGNYLNSTTDSSLLGTLYAHSSKTISIDKVTDFSVITFSWEYEYEGKSYTYNCNCQFNN